MRTDCLQLHSPAGRDGQHVAARYCKPWHYDPTKNLHAPHKRTDTGPTTGLSKQNTPRPRGQHVGGHEDGCNSRPPGLHCLPACRMACKRLGDVPHTTHGSTPQAPPQRCNPRRVSSGPFCCAGSGNCAVRACFACEASATHHGMCVTHPHTQAHTHTGSMLPSCKRTSSTTALGVSLRTVRSTSTEACTATTH